MTDADRPDPTRELWQNQGSEQFRMSIEELHMRIENIERRTRHRTWTGLAVCAFLIVFFGWWLTVFDKPAGDWSNTIEAAGAALIILAVAYLGWQLVKNRPAAVPVDRTAEHLRRELQRQRDFHRGAKLWSRLLVLFFAAAVFFTGFAIAHPEVRRTIVGEAIAMVVFTILAVPLNLRLAARYQRELDRIDHMTGEAQ